MKKIVLLVFLLFVVVFCFYRPSRPKAPHVTVLSFNIRLGSDWSAQQDGEYAWPHRQQAVLKMIAHADADIMGMQEVLPNQLHFLDSALVDYQRYGVGRDNGSDEGEAMAVFFKKDRFVLDSAFTYWLSETPREVSMGWDAACHRTVSMVYLFDKVAQRPLLYMDTHLDHMGPIARTNGLRLIDSLAKPMLSIGYPVVIGGDMNTAMSDTIFNILYADGFLSARSVAPVTDSSITYNGYGRCEPTQIDHFFVNGLKPMLFRTLTMNYGVPYVSDHYPIIMDAAY